MGYREVDPRDETIAGLLNELHEVLAEIERLREAIREHRESVMAETEYVTALKADAELWTVIDD